MHKCVSNLGVRMTRIVFLALAFVVWATGLFAQDLTIATITRPPFSLVENGKDTGFSLELWDALAKDMGLEYRLERVNVFADMLKLVETGTVDAAVANISITAAREHVMDFSQPIFESGLQIMVPRDAATTSVWSIFFSRDLLIAFVAAFALLLGSGMIMWRFERRAQPYFDHTAKEAVFPAFWWALNLIVNGGFEERMPRTPLGRLFGVFMVISSLFLVSVFVAKITAAITVDAIQSNVSGLNDLYGKTVGTVDGSTSAGFLTGRDLRYVGYVGLDELLKDFEAGSLDAVVFDAPILAYYANSRAGSDSALVGGVFLRENYGIALPSGSPLAEQINQSLLKLRENGTYARIYRKWFGNSGAGLF